MASKLKIIIVSDLHRTKFEGAIPKKVWEKCSFIISAGDYNCYPYPLPAVGVYGNHDTLEEVFEKKTLMNCHKKLVRFKGLTFLGIGGVFCGEKRFYSRRKRWYHQSHVEISRYLADAPKCDIFVTHERAYGIFDSEKYNGRPTGAPEFLEYIKRTQPKYYISGHLYSSQTAIKIGKTICLNPHGRAGDFIILTLPKGKVDVVHRMKRETFGERMKRKAKVYMALLQKNKIGEQFVPL